MTAKPNLLLTKLRGAAAQLPLLPATLALVWQAAPRLSAVWVGLLLVQGLLPAATVSLTKALVDSLVDVVNTAGEWETLRPVVLLALLMGLVLLLGEVLRSVGNWVRAAQAELVQDHLSMLVHAKSAAVDLAFYDQPEYFDRLYRARAEASYRPVALLQSLGTLLQNGITLLAMLAVLIPYGGWLPMALAASTLPALFIVLTYALRQYEFRVRTTSDERRTWYYDWLLTAREAAAESRLFGLAGQFQAAFQTLRGRLRTERLALVRDQGRAELAAGLAGMVVIGAAMVWMVMQTVQGRVTLGDLALVYAALNQGQGLMRSLLENIGQIYANSLFLGNLFEFLALQPAVVEPPNALRPTQVQDGTRAAPSIRFDKVAFAYPGNARQVLCGLNLNIAAGQVAAIVGSNGAGKSTLIKLLCRFYDPTTGRVELDGVDLRRHALADLRSNITVLFQEPVQYNATVAANIALGNGGDGLTPEIQAAAAAAGADSVIARLPQGYDTVLGTWFAGGTDLSTGEWQRIALARAFLRDAPIVVLDEPTSAMDSWAEADWLARFRGLVAGRTALIITHRFTTAMRADVIHVLEEGRIVESGSHAQLLALGGRYAASWHAQVGARSGEVVGTP